jgi:hypothetical protein
MYVIMKSQKEALELKMTTLNYGVNPDFINAARQAVRTKLTAENVSVEFLFANSVWLVSSDASLVLGADSFVESERTFFVGKPQRKEVE